MTAQAELTAQAEAWLAADPDPQTRAELRELSNAPDTDELRGRFAQSLNFGTAGLRGELGAGPNRMNRLVVRQVTAALALVVNDELRAAGDDVAGADAEPPRPTIMVGYDQRRNSDVFARDTAQVAAAFGCDVLLLDGKVPTPVLAHAALTHRCHAAVMVTASHNPPQDNGYKVYWQDGAQIIPPTDRKIEQVRKQLDLLPADLDELPGYIAELGASQSQKIRDASRANPGEIRTLPSESVIGAYVEAIAVGLEDLLGAEAAAAPEAPPIKCVYTPLHGVGLATLIRLFDRLGLPQIEVVSEQAEPDGAFPTVTFPNPEEPGSLDLALELARDVDADLVLANDPDADRLAVALREPDDSDEQTNYRVLSGNELGTLLADGLLSAVGERADRQASEYIVGNTIVSSQLLAKIAADHGASYTETLTGFKWLARLADHTPQRMLFGYEEALGYSVLPETVRDKDGISAAAAFVMLLRRWPTTPAARLEELTDQHGEHLSSQLSFRFDGASAQQVMAGIMGLLRTYPPRAIGAGEVASSRDYSAEPPDDSAAAAESKSQPKSKSPQPPANVLTFYLDDAARVIVRPSGTEPKLKCYIEVIGEVDSSSLKSNSSPARQRLTELEQAVRQLIDQCTAAAEKQLQQQQQPQR